MIIFSLSFKQQFCDDFSVLIFITLYNSFFHFIKYYISSCDNFLCLSFEMQTKNLILIDVFFATNYSSSQTDRFFRWIAYRLLCILIINNFKIKSHLII
jgi:hypothetical protein